jgi:hypothetical protein
MFWQPQDEVSTNDKCPKLTKKMRTKTIQLKKRLTKMMYSEIVCPLAIK